ncbi:lysophospholipid acyltransferase family protein [Spiribacter halobius]|uniref:lysophospholipid acyltransferase family protein n=1 Tax=Sediminicurvatus halobius TaxID=2182432 RepID=UPI00130495AD|nr:lysophospholipid acyltransferase family protein [Spiribacter halobius]UEX78926.1 1-acyl-sn-glycerol-3-phosphate acyltransferase [Spiribacter halobius]
MLRALRVVTLVLLVVFGGLGILLGVGVDRLRGRDPLAGAGRWAQALWCRTCCRVLGVRLRTTGEGIAPGPVLLLANHISWLDIICLAAMAPVTFLSKSEVRGWPIVGRVASALGTVYIDRGRDRAAERARAAIAESLAAGRRLVLFAEGTTGPGDTVRPFRPRLVQAALDAGTLVQPVTICYRNAAGGACRSVAFLDDQGLLASVWGVAGEAGLEAVVMPHAPLTPEAGRTAVTRESHRRVSEGLNALLDGAALSQSRHMSFPIMRPESTAGDRNGCEHSDRRG